MRRWKRSEVAGEPAPTQARAAYRTMPACYGVLESTPAAHALRLEFYESAERRGEVDAVRHVATRPCPCDGDGPHARRRERALPVARRKWSITSYAGVVERRGRKYVA